MRNGARREVEEAVLHSSGIYSFHTVLGRSACGLGVPQLLRLFAPIYYWNLMLILGGTLERNFDINIWWYYMRGMQCNVEFGNNLSYLSRTEDNHGKT
jgi:hypothetical protein